MQVLLQSPKSQPTRVCPGEDTMKVLKPFWVLSMWDFTLISRFLLPHSCLQHVQCVCSSCSVTDLCLHCYTQCVSR